jgi:RNA polymerase sigma-70 factor, ECF subfamily
VGGVERSIDTTSTLSPAAARTVSDFETRLRAHDRQVRSLAWRLVGDDVDDVLQQAYLKAFVQWPTFRGDASFGTWLHRIVYTTALDHVRGSQRRVQRERRSARPEHQPDDTELVIDHVLLEAALDELSADQRTVLLLVDGQGFGYDDVALVLGVAPGTIASRLHRARAAVRARLRTDDDTDDREGGAR